MPTVEDIFDVDNLYKSFCRARCGVNWKESTQRFASRHLMHLYNIHTKREYKKGFVEFDTYERGKKRHISSVHISERIIQKSLCHNVLLPVLMPSFIYDTSASFKGRGTSFAEKRLRAHLSRYYRKNGKDGFCLRMDIKKFFDSIDHDILKRRVLSVFSDKEIYEWIFLFIDEFPGGKGLGLGSEVSQVLANFYLSPIDHFIKDKLGCKYYHRYMDDMYIIHHDREFLKSAIKKISEQLTFVSLEFNISKTFISPLRKGVLFLQGRYFIEDDGRISIRMRGKSIRRIKRRLKKLFGLGIPYKDIYSSFQAWKGNVLKRFNGWKAVKRVEAFYIGLLNDSTRINW
jgi:retron-type reverse transcriptase